MLPSQHTDTLLGRPKHTVVRPRGEDTSIGGQRGVESEPTFRSVMMISFPECIENTCTTRGLLTRPDTESWSARRRAQKGALFGLRRWRALGQRRDCGDRARLRDKGDELADWDMTPHAKRRNAERMTGQQNKLRLTPRRCHRRSSLHISAVLPAHTVAHSWRHATLNAHKRKEFLEPTTINAPRPLSTYTSVHLVSCPTLHLSSTSVQLNMCTTSTVYFYLCIFISVEIYILIQVLKKLYRTVYVCCVLRMTVPFSSFNCGRRARDPGGSSSAFVCSSWLVLRKWSTRRHIS